MILLFALPFLFLTSAEKLLEEVQAPNCNCTRVLHGEDTTTDISPTFPSTSFTCWDRYDGYYADTEVDCTIFHYCQTWQFPSGLNETVKWDFACPQSTIFNQKILSCTPPNISFDCQDSPNYYWVNYNLTSTIPAPTPTLEYSTPGSNVGQQLIVGGIEPQSASILDWTESETTQSLEFVTSESGSGSEEPPSEVSENVNQSEQIKIPQ